MTGVGPPNSVKNSEWWKLSDEGKRMWKIEWQVMSDELWMMSDKWWVMEIEWQKLSDQILLAKQALNVERKRERLYVDTTADHTFIQKMAVVNFSRGYFLTQKGRLWSTATQGLCVSPNRPSPSCLLQMSKPHAWPLFVRTYLTKGRGHSSIEGGSVCNTYRHTDIYSFLNRNCELKTLIQNMHT